MKPKNRSYLVHSLESWIGESQFTLYGMAKQLRQTGKDLPAEFTEVRTAVVACQESIAQLSAKVDALFEADDALIERSRSTPLSDSEVTQVLSLNRQLAELTRFLKTTVDDATPRLEAKLADSNDLMFDYEIDAHIAYVLREDDPEYVEDDDNYLTTQIESLKGQPVSDIEDWAESHIQPGLLAEPHVGFSMIFTTTAVAGNHPKCRFGIACVLARYGSTCRFPNSMFLMFHAHQKTKWGFPIF